MFSEEKRILQCREKFYHRLLSYIKERFNDQDRQTCIDIQHVEVSRRIALKLQLYFKQTIIIPYG